MALTWTEKGSKYGDVAKNQYFAQLVDMSGKVTEVETEIDY